MAEVSQSELREVVAQLVDLMERRDELIRRCLAAGVRAVEVAEDARLSVPRIYQIRDGRR
jgi:hypothetical protein